MSMADSLITRPSLLVRIRAAHDADAWRQFVQLYAPLVYGFARKSGLQDADAADLVQDVLHQVASAAGRLDYDPRKGSFRSWLFQVIRNRMHKFLDARQPHQLGSGDTGVQRLLEQHPADDAGSEWDTEYDQRLFAWAVRQVQPEFEESSWQAFWQTAYEGRPPAETAAALGISVGAVYIAKSRIVARLTYKIQQLQA
jgi:RNA polymerase sigma-70 factor (ECF subfamily)